jgi:hypothetical protein
LVANRSMECGSRSQLHPLKQVHALVGVDKEKLARWKQVGNSSALVAQSILMIKKRIL